MKKLQIVGLGTRRFSQITLEALEALQKSESVCFIEVSKQQISEYLGGNVSLVDLHTDYLPTRLDVENYKAMIRTIVSQVSLHNTGSVAVAGHPRLGVFITAALEKWCEQNDVIFNCYEGISSFDVMANINQVDILENGTSLVDINRALLYDYKLNASLDHYFYHVCSVLNPVASYDNPSKGNNVNLLESYLLQFYPAGHNVYLIKASNSSDISLNQKISLQVKELQAYASAIDFSTTLFVPALKNRIINERIFKKMTEVVA